MEVFAIRHLKTGAFWGRDGWTHDPKETLVWAAFDAAQQIADEIGPTAKLLRGLVCQEERPDGSIGLKCTVAAFAAVIAKRD